MNTDRKPRVRVTWDENGAVQWPRVTATVVVPGRPAQTRLSLPIEDPAHQLGGQCPHCGGLGRYLHHLRRSWDKCFRCDGKGVLDAFDIALLRLRLQGGGPVNRVYGGVPRKSGRFT